VRLFAVITSSTVMRRSPPHAGATPEVPSGQWLTGQAGVVSQTTSGDPGRARQHMTAVQLSMKGSGTDS